MKTDYFCHVPTSRQLVETIRGSITSYISEKRLYHTYSVEKEALNLANIFFPLLEIDNSYLSDISCAALLHDITKQFPVNEQLSLCKKYGISVSEWDKTNTAVLHSKTGAYYAKEVFGINDIVFDAVYCHTTGKADMNIFEKIIFISDYIEETRTHSSCKEAHDFFYSNIENYSDKLRLLDQTILMSIDSTLSYLIERHCSIDTETVNARNFIIGRQTLK